MKSYLKAFALFALVLVSPVQMISTANAQVPPMVLCNGGWIPQGTPCGAGAYGGQMGQYGGYNIPIPQGVGMGQPFPAMVNGQRIIMRCSWSDRAVSGVAGAAIGNVLAYAVNRFGHRNVVDRTGATVIGGVAGATILCSPYAVDDGEQQALSNYGIQRMSSQPSPQQYQQQGAIQQRGGEAVTLPAKCSFDNGVVAYTYEGQAGCDKIAAKMAQRVEAKTEVVQPQQVAQQTAVTADTQEKRVCKTGSQWKRLNWEGHPQHGKHVCLPDGDTHKFEGE